MLAMGHNKVSIKYVYLVVVATVSRKYKKMLNCLVAEMLSLNMIRRRLFNGQLRFIYPNTTN